MKNFNIIILFLIAVLTLGACSAIEIEDQAKSVFKESSNLEKVKLNEFTKENEKLTNALINSLGIETSNVKIEKLEEYKEFQSNIEKAKDKTELIIKEVVSHSNDNAEVLVDIAYLNVGSTVAEKLGEELERNIVKIYNGHDVNEEEFYTETFTVLNEYVSEILEDKGNKYMSVAKDVKIKLKKEKETWVIKNFDEDVMNALTLNFYKEQKYLIEKKAKEINENRIFIENESNLKYTFELVKEFILSKEISDSDLINHNEEIAKLVKSNVGVNSEVVSKVGQKEDLYYIVINSGKIVITVIDEGKTFTFTESIR